MFSQFNRYLHFSDPTQFCRDIGPSMQAHSMHARKLVCLGQILLPKMSCMFFWFHRYFDLSDLTESGWDIGPCTQAYSVHACLVKLCAQRGPACSPDSIDILISLIRPNLAEIWACACKHTACMHTSLPTQVILFAQGGPAWSPNSVDTLISLFQPKLPEIWA